MKQPFSFLRLPQRTTDGRLNLPSTVKTKQQHYSYRVKVDRWTPPPGHQTTNYIITSSVFKNDSPLIWNLSQVTSFLCFRWERIDHSVFVWHKWTSLSSNKRLLTSEIGFVSSAAALDLNTWNYEWTGKSTLLSATKWEISQACSNDGSPSAERLNEVTAVCPHASKPATCFNPEQSNNADGTYVFC